MGEWTWHRCVAQAAAQRSRRRRRRRRSVACKK
jgi:hypothetical protein